jgi:hypothetical protein
MQGRRQLLAKGRGMLAVGGELAIRAAPVHLLLGDLEWKLGLSKGKLRIVGRSGSQTFLFVDGGLESWTQGIIFAQPAARVGDVVMGILTIATVLGGAKMADRIEWVPL